MERHFKTSQLQRLACSKMGFYHISRLSALLLLLLVLFIVGNTQALDTSTCTSPLGMESLDIPDMDITASSAFDAGNVGPQNARVRVERQGGAWCPKNQITSDAEEWLQIDLHTVHVITATETQGRFGNGQGQEFTEKYILSYWRPELGKWVRYRDSTGNEILRANINTYLAVKTELSPPIFASKLRFLPYSIHRRTVCLRVEIYGCPFRGGLTSYTMTQGSKRGDNWHFYDHTYDGLWDGNTLRNGLGLLSDGRGGPPNFKDDFYGHERGKGWVGWKNDTRHSNNPVEIVFKFDGVREFSAVHIHASNQFTKDIQVFSEARVYFSIGGKIYPEHPISFVTMEDCIFEDPKNISINLHRHVAQYVKIQLFWAAKWILISEITFDSQPAMGNFTEESAADVASSVQVITEENNHHLQPNAPASAAGVGGTNNLQTQSDASEVATADGSHYNQHETNSTGHQPSSIAAATNPTDTSNGWSVGTIIMTAIISSFVAILMVLLFILTALVLRNKLNPNGKLMGSSLTSSPHGNMIASGLHHHHVIGTTLPYDQCAQINEYGSRGGGGVGCYATVTPAEMRKYAEPGVGLGVGMGPGVEYQEPFSNTNPSPAILASFPGANQTMVAATMKGKMAEYYSCTIVPTNNTDSSNEYEYAVPNELGKLLPTQTTNCQQSPKLNIHSIPNSPAISGGARSQSRCGTGISSSAIQLRFRELGIFEVRKERLRMLRKLGDGAFGTVYIGEIEDASRNEKSLVAVKHLLRNATDKDKSDFLEEVRLLSSLSDPNVAQVLGVCTEDEPYSVILEFLELGDLCQFLRQNDALLPTASQKLSSSSLLYMASQIASGMRFLESRNIVHRDLATRNCIIGHGLLVKISHFATDTDLYSSHYYRLDGKMPLPIRWMAWESLFLGKYSTKSDVWSFGVTLWEILSFARHSPYSSMTNQEVLNNLRKLSVSSEDDPFEPLSKPAGCSRDIYQLICDTWRRNDDDRPTFWEINSFLTRKNLNFVPPST